MIKINWARVKKLCRAGAKGPQIAGDIGISLDTLYDRTQEKYGIGFQEFRQTHLAAGDAKLYEKQYDKALEGDNTMLVFLGKNRLGQRDRVDHHVDMFTSLANTTGKSMLKPEESVEDFENRLLNGGPQALQAPTPAPTTLPAEG